MTKTSGKAVWWVVLSVITAMAEVSPGQPRTTRKDDLASASGRLGGVATVNDAGPNAFSFPAGVLTSRELRAFAVGNAIFKENWVIAPASATGRDGLGPLFNAASCSGCHARDGRSRPPVEGERDTSGLLVRIGVAVPGRGDAPHPLYGSQVQDRAIPGVAPEARVRVDDATIEGTFADGTPFELIRPTLSLVDPAYGPLGDRVVLGGRVAPHLVGLGLLEAVSDETIEALADPDDRNRDGISGRPHRLPSPDGRRVLGRFGWKATQPSVFLQTAAAFANDIGITSSAFPDEVITPLQRERMRFVSGGSPELDLHKLQRVTFYCQTLAVPAQRHVGDSTVERGRRLFRAAGCTSCHVERLRTGPTAVVPAFTDQIIHPYTDLLLHDMGPALADGKTDGDARPEEWRTPPLWGLGLIPVVSGHTRYLHDGRARDLQEAILWHGGEAEGSQRAFLDLGSLDREALLAFLDSL